MLTFPLEDRLRLVALRPHLGLAALLNCCFQEHLGLAALLNCYFQRESERLVGALFQHRPFHLQWIAFPVRPHTEAGSRA